MTLERFEPLPGKGTTRCNRMGCQVELAPDHRMWNTITRAWYCTACARRINQSSEQSSMGTICVPADHPHVPKP